MAAQAGKVSRRLGIGIAVAIVILFMIASTVATFYTDVRWFTDVGHTNVFWIILLSEIVVGLVFGAIAFVLVYANVLVARRMAPKRDFTVVTDQLPSNDPREQLEEFVTRIRTTLEPYVRWVILAICLLVAWGAGAAMASGWETLRLATVAGPFGKLDPQFGRDVSFFVFTLPALRMISDWIEGILWTTLIISGLVHLYDGAIRPAEKLRGFEPHVKAHLSVLAALIVAAKAFDYWLSVFELDFSPRGQVLGASYTDVNAQIPAYTILIVIALVSAVVLLVNIRFKGWRIPVIALGVWIGAWVIVGGIYPAVVQQLRVQPNELQLERPYIARNITMTRNGFDLERVLAKPFPAAYDLTAKDLIEATSTIANVRLWDPNVVVNSYKQLQEIRYYYDFKDVDIDRYVIDGTEQQLLVSVREMNVGQLLDQAKTWVNQHLVYTHGYGIVASPVNQSTPDGLPLFIVKDLPPKSTTDLTVKVPGIYFGEEATTYAIVDTTQKEFDYPSGADNVTTEYSGANGIPVGSLFDRLMFALRFGDGEILFTDAIRPTSRVLFRRDIRERVATLAPWLSLDGDPYPVITKAGRIVWVLDGYTWSSYYPYSERYQGDVNYVRNSVKVTIDAYDGTTTFYGFDEADPVLAAYAKLFPGLITPRSELPAEMEAHFRYPEDLFKMQAEVYANYHMLDPQVFYNKEDAWAIPGAATGDPMAPFYVLMALPGETEQNFLLMQPYTPRSKDNMISWVAAKSDPGVYGQRIVFAFPKQRLILGPEQIKARINQEPEISRNLTLLNQQGSRVIHGNLLVIPIKDSIVYIEPIYLTAEQSPIPELKYVVVAYSDKVVMAPNLATALVQVFGAAPTTAEGAGPGTATATSTPSPTVPGGAGGSKDAQLARSLYDQAIKAQRAGDWATYGKLIQELGVVLQRMATTKPTK
jgi:uncharacterized protein